MDVGERGLLCGWGVRGVQCKRAKFRISGTPIMKDHSHVLSIFFHFGRKK